MGEAIDSLRDDAVRRLEQRRRFHAHAAFYVVSVVVLFAIRAMTEYQNAGGWPTGFATGRENRDWDPWIMYPVIAGTVLLAVHAWHTYARGTITERDVRREMDRISAAR